MTPAWSLGCVCLVVVSMGTSCGQGRPEYERALSEDRKLFNADRRSSEHPASQGLTAFLTRLRDIVYGARDLESIHSEGLVFSVAHGAPQPLGKKESQAWRANLDCTVKADAVDYYGDFARVLWIEYWRGDPESFPLYFERKRDKWYLLHGSLDRSWPIPWRYFLSRYIEAVEHYRFSLEIDSKTPKYPEGYREEDLLRLLDMMDQAYKDAGKVPVEAWCRLLATNALAVRRRVYDRLQQTAQFPLPLLEGYFDPNAGSVHNPAEHNVWLSKVDDWLYKKKPATFEGNRFYEEDAK